MEKQNQIASPPSKKVGFTKLYTGLILLVNIVILGYVLMYCWVNKDSQILNKTVWFWGGLITVTTGFTTNKSKNENIEKIKGFYELQKQENQSKIEGIVDNLVSVKLDNEQSNLEYLLGESERYSDDV